MLSARLEKPRPHSRPTPSVKRSHLRFAQSPESGNFIQRKSSCACGGSCPHCSAKSAGPGLQISQPSDSHEVEADRAADQIMRMPDGATAAPIAQTADESTVSRSCSSCASSGAGSDPSEVVEHGTSGGGHSLDPQTRSFMEPRFGQDFSDVRVHTGSRAAESASSIGATAYTVGRDIVFGADRYAPHTSQGRALLAHELTHTVQQANTYYPQIARTADPTKFSCPANRNGASGSPFGDLDAIDQRAQGLAMATSTLAIIGTILDPSTAFDTLSQSYRARFGTPSPQGTKFRNRFTGALLATREQAAQQELSVISSRLDRIATFLGGSIRYTCHNPNVQFSHSNCVSTCRPNDMAYSCTPVDLRRIEICPDFWTLSADQQVIAIIHEAVHMLLNFKFHGHGSRAARGSNPECYASLVADAFNIAPFDTRCPALP